MKTSTPVLIVGINGKTGSRVNTLLQARGIDTRGVSRSSAIPFDWDDQATWASALAGTDSAYVSYQPDLAVPQAEASIRDFVAMAKSQGIKHIVLLSGRGEEGAQRAENILINSGLSWNIVRASWFYQNFSESFMADGIMSGDLVLPADKIREPFVDAGDIAEVAVAALTQPELQNRLFEVTGPSALTFAECVGKIAAACQRPIQYSYLPVDSYISHLDEQGVPADYQWLLRELFTEVMDGRNSHITHGVEEVLGRPPLSFDDYVKKTVAEGLWSGQLSHYG